MLPQQQNNHDSKHKNGNTPTPITITTTTTTTAKVASALEMSTHLPIREKLLNMLGYNNSKKKVQPYPLAHPPYPLAHG